MNMTIKNRLDEDILVTEEMYRDVLQVYGLDLKSHIPTLFGTSFNFNNKKIGDDAICFDFVTNDERDGIRKIEIPLTGWKKSA